MDRDVFMLGIRVLRSVCDHEEPASEDISKLRNLAESDEELDMPVDWLACAVITRTRRAVEARPS